MQSDEKCKVIIVGAGGHGKVVADIIKLNGDEVLGYLDDKNPDELPEYNILGTTKLLGKRDCYYFVAVGNCEVRERLMSAKVKWYTAIHPSAVIANDTTIGDGSCVMANAVINSGTKIGMGVIVNTAASIDHDCIINEYVHVAPGVHISGTVTVGKCTWIGVGSTISNNLAIANNCLIGAGTLVIKDINKPGTYVGVPARLIKE